MLLYAIYLHEYWITWTFIDNMKDNDKNIYYALFVYTCRKWWKHKLAHVPSVAYTTQCSLRYLHEKHDILLWLLEFGACNKSCFSLSLPHVRACTKTLSHFASHVLHARGNSIGGGGGTTEPYEFICFWVSVLRAKSPRVQYDDVHIICECFYTILYIHVYCT